MEQPYTQYKVVWTIVIFGESLVSMEIGSLGSSYPKGDPPPPPMNWMGCHKNFAIYNLIFGANGRQESSV